MKNYFSGFGLAVLFCLTQTSPAHATGEDLGSAVVNSDKTINEKPDAGDAAVTSDQPYDPIEPVNRVIFVFDDKLDYYIYQPVARSYVYILPQWGRNRVSNVIYNLGEPLTVINSTLQADPENAFTSFWRFMLNTTVGLLGAFDVAKDFGLKPRQEDFGQTLGVWGWQNSSYIVLPFLGPSTLRDGIGLGVEYVADPTDLVLTNGEQTAEFVVDLVDKRAELLPVTDDIEKNSLDKYSTYRSIYTQKRRGEILNGNDEPQY